MGGMKIFRLLCGFGLLALLASNVWTMSRWSESRGVYDDVCYLRQAHLFQKYGLRGIDTNVVFDDDDYLKNKLKAIGFAEWNDVKRVPCHTLIPAADKYVMQYPPGTGFALSLFREGFQVVPLYLLANLTILAFALLALFRAREPASLALAAVFGLAALYLMINPSKASYSVPPTMMVCAAAGFLTAKYFAAQQRQRLLLIALTGLLIGLSVNFRLPNLFLAVGYCLYLAGAFLLARSKATFLQGASFGIAFLIGIAPTLIANAINAGSPFSTTYGGVDVAPPELNPAVLLSYLVDVQFILLADICRLDGLALALRSGPRPAGHRSGRPEPWGKPDFLHDPSDIYAILYHSDRHALALDLAVRNARSARRTGRGPCGLPTTGQRLIAV
jgi:hypothetical protein